MNRKLQLLSDCTNKEGFIEGYNSMAVVEIEYDSYDGFDIEIYKYENTSFHNEYHEEKSEEELLYSFCIFRNGEYVDNRYGYSNKKEVIDRIWSIIQDNK